MICCATSTDGEDAHLILYGIKNCDSCRKAQYYLREHGRQFEFHDLRADGLDADLLGGWCDRSPWQELLNTRSRTRREITEDCKHDTTEEQALALMLRHPTLVKRPVLAAAAIIEIGFSAERYAQLLA